jgi:hypothetical protein
VNVGGLRLLSGVRSACAGERKRRTNGMKRDATEIRWFIREHAKGVGGIPGYRAAMSIRRAATVKKVFTEN